MMPKMSSKMFPGSGGVRSGVCGELIRGRYYPQIAPRKGDASPLLNGPGDSETIGVPKRTATKSAKTA